MRKFGLLFSFFFLLIWQPPGLPAQDNWGYRGEAAFDLTQKWIRSSHPLNPSKDLFDFERSQRLAELDIETDWYPQETLRIHARGLLQYIDAELDTDNDSRNGSNLSSSHDPDPHSSSGIERNHQLLEGNLQYTLSETTFLDIGKILETWGTGFAFNPVNVLVPPKDPSDPSDTREGATLLKIEVLFEDLTLTAILAGVADEHTSDQAWIFPDSKEKRRIAFKLDHTLGDMDFSWLHVQGGLDGEMLNNRINGSPIEPVSQKPVTGMAWTTVVGNALELHAEYAVQPGRNRAIPRTRNSPIRSSNGALLVPTLSDYANADDNERLFSKILIGGQYTFENEMNLILEWFYDETGYTTPEWNRIKKGIRDTRLENAYRNLLFGSAQGNPFAGFLRQTLLNLQSTSVRQQYAFGRFATSEFGNRFELETVLLYNLDDSSFLLREELIQSYGDHWRVELEWTTFQGSTLSQYGLSPHQHHLRGGIIYLF